MAEPCRARCRSAATNGVATFADLSIDKTGTGYKLTASSTGLTSATSSTFNVTAGAAVQLGFTQQPSGGTGGVAWATQPKVAIQDALGNTVTTSTAERDAGDHARHRHRRRGV